MKKKKAYLKSNNCLTNFLLCVKYVVVNDNLRGNIKCVAHSLT